MIASGRDEHVSSASAENVLPRSNHESADPFVMNNSFGYNFPELTNMKQKAR
jgi:hypothetical protein